MGFRVMGLGVESGSRDAASKAFRTKQEAKV